MPVIKCKSHIEVYKARAVSFDLHELSGRGSNKGLTEFISNEIIKTLKPFQSRTLIDIGCGDGTLLRLAAPKIQAGIGVLPSNEEVAKVQAALAAFPNLSLCLGYSHEIPVASEIADYVVCNGVFILLDEAQISLTLAEIARVSKPGALVFIGEIPRIDEMAGRTYGDSIIKWLFWVLTNSGFVAFYKASINIFNVALSDKKFIIAPKKVFYATPDKIIDLAKQHSLKNIKYWDHMEVNDNKIPVPSRTRMDYLFQKLV